MLCTNDAELANAALDCDTPLIVVRDLSALWRWHGTTQPLDDDIANAIERWLVDLHDSDVDGPLQRLTIDPMGLGARRPSSPAAWPLISTVVTTTTSLRSSSTASTRSG